MFPISSGDIFLDEPFPFEPDCIFEDLLADCNNNDKNNISSEGKKIDAPSDKVSKKRQRKPSSREELNKEDKTVRNSNESKKVLHREIERQRRQEMASLYVSLRSHLPLEYIKGKRSISDHMHQAAGYIKDLEKKIEKMKASRETLKKISGIESSCSRMQTEQRKSTITVKVDPCFNGLEILFVISNNCLDDEEVSFPLSKVLFELVRRGLNVISCTSTRANEQLLQKIQIEADHLTSIDLSELQEKLFDLINLA